jgi:hypothetical protein
MRLSIEPERDNRGEEEKGKMGKYRRGKRKGENLSLTFSLIIMKR